MYEILGGKGANLAEMTRLGIPVPPGFTISTEVCTEFYRAGRKLPAALRSEVMAALERVERALGARFGDPENPLLVSVRSGARVSARRAGGRDPSLVSRPCPTDRTIAPSVST